MAAALWHVRFDDEDIGDEDLELVLKGGGGGGVDFSRAFVHCMLFASPRFKSVPARWRIFLHGVCDAVAVAQGEVKTGILEYKALEQARACAR